MNKKTLSSKDKAKKIELREYFDQERTLRQCAVDTLTQVIAEDGLPDEVRPVDIVQVVTRRMWKECWPKANQKELLPILRQKVQLCITRRLTLLTDSNFESTQTPVPLLTSVPLNGTTWRYKRTAELTMNDLRLKAKYEQHKVGVHKKNKDKATMKVAAIERALTAKGIEPDGATKLFETGLPIDTILEAFSKKASVTSIADKTQKQAA